MEIAKISLTSRNNVQVKEAMKSKFEKKKVPTNSESSRVFDFGLKLQNDEGQEKEEFEWFF